MSEHAPTLEEELAEKGIVGSYIWKPNRLFAKVDDRYIPVDTISDGSAEDVAATVAAEGQAKVNEIDTLAETQKALIAANNQAYNNVKANLLQTYQRMSNYFANHGLIALKTIIDTAIVNLNEL